MRSSAAKRSSSFGGVETQQELVMNVLNYGEESVSVAIEEVKPENWVEKVYKPDIQKKWDELYKKPGYDPSDL
jgi:4-oxalocrotonate tautomerase